MNVVDWSRAQFAMTAIYHWLFVPLTLGLGFICAIMETLYYRTGDPFWKRTTKFWIRIFAINFAIGVATGLILEFEFGTNWSNYSHFVGDIFGAPLAIEGIMAFFLEATFFAVMFFGWNKVSKGFHLASTWITAIGANLSALWILVANAWMQSPVGTTFNVETARQEMTSFWDVVLSPVAINKFFHTVTSAYVLSAVVVVGISAWYLLRKREEQFARRSIVVASVFGLFFSLMAAMTGDGSAVQVARTQPMKLAAMEALYDGRQEAGLVAVGALRPVDRTVRTSDDSAFAFRIEIPKMLSLMAFRDANAFVPGINDLVYGNEKYGIPSTEQRMELGREALEALEGYREARRTGDEQEQARFEKLFDPDDPVGKAFIEKQFASIGYGFLKEPTDVVPNVPTVFYSFRVMVALGGYFIRHPVLLLPAHAGRQTVDAVRDVVVDPAGLSRVGVGLDRRRGRTPAVDHPGPAADRSLRLENQHRLADNGLLPVRRAVHDAADRRADDHDAANPHRARAPRRARRTRTNLYRQPITERAMDTVHIFLQHYWWFIISLLGALLVFLLFVQGGQAMLYTIGRTETERNLIVNSLGRKWELTFTTLVTFGGAFFASFPLFYSTSFGGAFYVWMLILLVFVIQAVSYEYRRKPSNFLGEKTFNAFLIVNGIAGTFLLGTAVGTLFFGAQFTVDRANFASTDGFNTISQWATPWYGLDALADPRNILLGLAVLFLSRVLGLLYFMNNIDEQSIFDRSRRHLRWNAAAFVATFVAFLVTLLLARGWAVDPASGRISEEPYKYLHNLLAMPVVFVLLVAGILSVLWGIAEGLFRRGRRGIWFAGAGTVLTVLCLLLTAGYNDTAYYPSLTDPQSSLTIYNSSSSRFTLYVMSIVSLLIPFVVAYIWYVWRSMNRVRISEKELGKEDHPY